MSLKVTEQDRRRVRLTAMVFTIIFIVCAGLAGLFCAITPRAQDVKTITIGDVQEELSAMVGSHDGKTYFLQSKNLLCEFDTFTDEPVSEINLTEAIAKKVSDDGKAPMVSNSFNEWRIVSALSGASNNYFVVGDNVGNMFKLERNENGQLTVANDYLLVADTTKVFKGIDNIKDRLFTLVLKATATGSFFYVEEYDLENLAQGTVNTKFLWDQTGDVKTFGEGEDKVEGKKISFLSGDTGVLAFYAYEDSLIFIKDGGGIIRLSTELRDTNYGDEEIDFFEDAAKPADKTEEQEALENSAYENGKRAHLLSRLAYWTVEYVIKYSQEFKVNGVAILASQITDKDGNAVTNADIRNKAKRAEVEEKTQELFKDYTTEELISIVDGCPVSPDEKTKIKSDAEAAGEAARKEVSSTGREWLLEYNPSTMSMYVDAKYFDKTSYASFIPGTSLIKGMVLSKPNSALYYTNFSDGYLYSLEISDLKALDSGDSISDKAVKIESIHTNVKKGQSFDTFGNALGYNKYANTLYLKFLFEREVKIVDINDKNDIKVVSTFTGAFDMFNLSGDEDNTVTHIFRKVTKLDENKKDHIYYYATTFEPERFENKGTITILFVIFLAIAVVTFLMGLWLWLNLRTEKGVKKVVFIAKDTKKNKYIYFALIFFIAMLIMFCYYEAIGAIAMSFFDYTKEKPAWVWNNFANYIKIFNSTYYPFWPSVVNMLFFLLFDLILSIIPPIIFAILLILIRNKVTSSWIRSLMFIPGIIPSIAGMLIWRVGIYGDDGLLNQMIMAMGGTKIEWLLEPKLAKWSLILMGFPYIGGYLIFYGGMINIPNEYHEAGKLEGLSTIKRFLKIDIPLIMPQIKYIFITTFIASVQNFARTQVLAASVDTPVQSMYTMMQEQGNYGMSSAYATLIFVFLFAAIATNFKMQKQDAMGADL